MELQNVDKVILKDGHSYKGWGYYKNDEFIPHGCGKKYFKGYYAYGNFVDDVLDGPAIVSHDYFMNTMQFKNNRGNGWGLCINGGVLIEFGYYENSQLKKNLIDFVEWYFQVLENSGRASSQTMLTMYTFIESKGVSDLLIGYRGGKTNSGLTIPYMGFHFLSDGSVWVGTTDTQKLSGLLLHFRADGIIDAGEFFDGNLVERKPLKEIIDYYSYKAFISGQKELVYPDNVEIKINFSYFSDSNSSNEKQKKNDVLDERQLSIITKLAEQGDAEAQFKLGEYYLDDNNEFGDEKMAYDFFLKAANNGHIESMFQTGLAHANGWATDSSENEAFKWFTKAADLGHAHSICWVGHCYLNGIGTKTSKTKGVEFIKKAAELNNTNGLMYYGDLLMDSCYRNVEGIEHNYDKGVEYIKKAAILGDVNAQTHLGDIFIINPKYSTKEGIEWLKKAAEQGSAAAQLSLGNQYLEGHGVPRSYIEAVEWFSKAAEQNEETAQFNLGTCYFEGKGVKKSYSDALTWFKKASDNGHGIWSKIYMGKCYYCLDQYDKALEIFEETADDWNGESNYYLGMIYYEGKGVDISLQKAFNNFIKSADKKNPKAQLMVGLMYKEGKGVIKNEEQAYKWFKLSAEANNADAQYQLARCYVTGTGTGKDRSTALHWMKKAAENGNVYADWEYSIMSDPDGFNRAIDNFKRNH